MKVPEKQRVAGPGRCNNYLKTTLVEAISGSFKNVGYFPIRKVLQYRPGVRGSKRAAVAIGHQSLKDVYYILSTVSHIRIGAEAAQNRKSDARKCSMIQEPEGMGYSVQKVEASA